MRFDVVRCTFLHFRGHAMHAPGAHRDVIRMPTVVRYTSYHSVHCCQRAGDPCAVWYHAGMCLTLVVQHPGVQRSE